MSPSQNPRGSSRLLFKILCVSFLLLSLAVVASATTLATENRRIGTNLWQLKPASVNGEIQGYTGQDSVLPGETLDFYVSTTSQLYSVAIFRMGYYQGKGGALKMQETNLVGQNQGSYVGKAPYPSDCSSTGVCTTSLVSKKDSLGQETNVVEARWKKSFSIVIPSTWVSGYYLAKLHEAKTGTEWHVPFVVRSSTPTPLLYDVPFETDQAYNYWGGASVYRTQRVTSLATSIDRATTVSYNRPYATNSGTGNFFFFEYPMIRFLEEQGVDLSYTTDIAIASEATHLGNGQGVLTSGHAEYMSQEERFFLEAFYHSGGAVAFFGGNDLFWQTRQAPDSYGRQRRNVTCYKVALNSSANQKIYRDPVSALGFLGVPTTTDNWTAPDVNYPDDLFLKTNCEAGVQSGNYFPMYVYNTSSWVFAGTGLNNGDAVPNVVGWETDKANWSRIDQPGPGEKISVIGNSPFVIENRTTTGISSAVLTENSLNGGLVFHAGTVVWALGLSSFDSYLRQQGYPPVPMNTQLRKITRNILDRMALPAGSRKK